MGTIPNELESAKIGEAPVEEESLQKVRNPNLVGYSSRIEDKSYNCLHLYLIKPSKYDDDGYVIRHLKGVLPSNTLSCLYTLSEDVRDRRLLGENLKWKIYAVDETVQQVKVRKIIRASLRKKAKTVVCLVGVQSNQFPRAADLAMEFRAAGIDVLLGGFHVSGIMATLPGLSAELRHLQEAGVTLVGGEVEGRWEGILRDALCGALRPVYDLLMQPPEINTAPVPRIPKNLLNRYAVRHFATLDCGRGCPYQCSFCTVINVQGRRMRFRAVDAIMERIRDNYFQHKIRHYFFTDDNFCRNKNWEQIFDGLILLHEERGIKISFMMQVDTLSHQIENFVEKASLAGCSQVFIGMESLNEANLRAAGKLQNRTASFKQLIDTYHKAGIVTHLAYIIGFPFDTEESVREDMARLRELGAEQASFFMLTPLPGSMDYKKVLNTGTILDCDLNNFDSFHETFRHANMDNGCWSRSYQEAWNCFYSVESMKEILKKVKPERYWGIFLNFVWYKNAFQVEGGHPMIHGFFRLKGRRSRRPTYAVETRWAYFKRRMGDVMQTFSGWVKLALEMEEVWLATRQRGPLEQQVLREFLRVRTQVSEWRNLKLSELQSLYRKAAQALERSAGPRRVVPIEIPSRFQLWIQKLDVFSDSLTFTRKPMIQFWKKNLEWFKNGRLHRIAYSKAAFMGFREGVLFVRFIWSVWNHFVSSSGYARKH